MRDIGSANVQGTLYDLLSPRVVGDYIENIGAACQNPDGYAANKIFVAYDSSMNQHLYKTTAQITQGTQITSSNCEQTSLSELLSGSGSSSSLEDLSDTDISSKTAGDIVEYNNSTGKWENTQKLVNLEKSIAPVEDGATLSQAYAIGEKFIRGGVRYKAKTDLASGTQFSSLIINTNYEAADDVSSEIQTLTNNLNDEVEARAKFSAHNFLIQDRVPTSSTLSVIVNEDKSITVSGTTTNESWFQLNDQLDLSGDFIGSGCPSGGSNDTYMLFFVRRNADSTADEETWKDFGGGVQISLESNKKFRAFILIRAGVTINATFYPMIRRPYDKYSGYAPYAKTNRELTVENEVLTNKLDDEIETRVKLGAHNLARPYTGYALGTRNNNPNIVSLTASIIIVAEIEPNESYIITKDSSYGDRFRIAGFNTISFADATITGTDIANIPSEGEYNFTNTQGYKYLVVCVNANSSDTTSQIKPMIRLASDINDTYEPYVKTNRELTEYTNAIEPMLNVLGAKNLLKNTASSATVNGITFTVNSDGSVTVNGTATGNAYIRAANITDKTCVLNKGKYTFNGCPAGGSLSGYYAYATDDTTSFNDIGDGVDFTISSDNTPLAVIIYVRNGTTVSNLTFYPMIRPASIEDDTYVPYAKTNRELTEYTSDVASNSYTKDGILVRVYRCGRQVMFLLGGTATADIAATTVLCTLDSKFVPYEVVNSIAIKGANTVVGKLNISTNGQVYFDTAISNGEGPRLTSLCYIAKNP